MDIQKKVERLVAQANFSLRKDVLLFLKKAYAAETDKKAKQALAWVLDNAAIAARESLAICQDTGLPVVFVEVGKSVRIDSGLVEDIKKGIARGYKNHYLRASIVDPVRRGTPAYEGALVHIEFAPGIKGIRISVLPKGFGSENKSKLKMFNPTARLEQIEDFVVESVKAAGPESCPPFIVGVGIGGTSDHALLMAKQALLDKLDSSHKDRSLNTLAKSILGKINALRIGPMGLGGRCTALAVRIKTAPTHIAGLPVGVNISCHALRSATTYV